MPKKVDNDYVEISFSKFLIPVAIVVAGVVIALAIFFGSKDSDEQKNVDTLGMTDVVFDDPNIVEASLKIDFDEGAYVGNLENAKYAIVEFSDYQCQYCKKNASETFPQMKDQYIDKDEIIYIFRELAMYPPKSMTLSLLGQCIFENEGIEEYLSYRSKAYSVEFEEDSELLSAFEIGAGSVKDCFEDETYVSRIENNSVLSQEVGVQGVPGFVVGTLSEDGEIEGFLIPGAYPFSMFEEVLNHLKN